MEAVIADADKNGDEALSLEELIVAITSSHKLASLGDIFQWRQHFTKFDVDYSGFVDSDHEVLTLVQSTASGATPAPITEHLKEHCGDRQLSWQVRSFPHRALKRLHTLAGCSLHAPAVSAVLHPRSSFLLHSSSSFLWKVCVARHCLLFPCVRNFWR